MHMSENTQTPSSNNYLVKLRAQLEADLEKVEAGTMAKADFIKSYVDEVYASYKRGKEAGAGRRNKALPKKEKRGT